MTTTEFPLVEAPDWMIDKKTGRLAQFLPTLPIDNGEIHILTCSGIGDFAWVWAKLSGLRHVFPGRKLCFHFPDDPSRRVRQYTDLLDIESSFLSLDIREILSYPGEFTQEDYAEGGLFYVHANRHLENGKRIEEWHPWLPLRNPIRSQMGSWEEFERKDYVTVHMCMASYVEQNWLPRAWGKMLEEIEKNFAPVKVVGALWDTDFAKRVFDFYTPSIPPVLDRTLQCSLANIGHAKAHIGLDSGLTILAKYMGVPALQAFPRWLRNDKPDEAHPNGTWMPGSYDFDFHEKSEWCYVDELRESIAPWLEKTL